MDLPLHLLSENFVKTKGITQETPFEIVEVDAKELLCARRFDLAAKIAYIEARENGADMSFAKELYRKHIEAFSEGYFTEPGDKNKTTFEDFLSVFDELIDSFKHGGFDKDQSLIPIGKDGIILDGAHRTACAIYFGGKVNVISFPQFEVKFDYSYFRERRLSEEMLEYMAVVYSRYSCKPLYLACLWPVAPPAKRPVALHMIAEKHQVVFSSSYELNRNGLRNLMLQVYQHQAWVGTVSNRFPGVLGKVDACFAPFVSTEAILFENGDLDEVLQMKTQIRDVFKLEKHAIHISDSSEETRLMASLLFNSNSRHALNNGKPDEFPECYTRIRAMKEQCSVLNMQASLAYYGIEASSEIGEDYGFVESYNPRTFFSFDGLKLPSIATLQKNRANINKDACRRISALAKLDENSEQKRRGDDIKTAIIWEVRKIVLKCKQIAMKITQKIGVYEYLHSLLHR